MYQCITFNIFVENVLDDFKRIEIFKYKTNSAMHLVENIYIVNVVKIVFFYKYVTSNQYEYT